MHFQYDVGKLYSPVSNEIRNIEFSTPKHQLIPGLYEFITDSKRSYEDKDQFLEDFLSRMKIPEIEVLFKKLTKSKRKSSNLQYLNLQI
jgi:hypothetical protein